MRNFLTTLAVIIGIGIAIWISVMLFVGVAVVGAAAYALFYARAYLVRKGILNPRPGVPLEEQQPEQITVIDGDFERIEESEKKDHL